jgi:two-component system LytT family response regulator
MTVESLERDDRASKQPKERFVVKSKGHIYFIRAKDIDWCRAAGNYVHLQVGTTAHLIRGTLDAIKNDLNPKHFVQVHRTTIVNLDRIHKLQPTINGEYIIFLHDETRLTLSRGYRKQLLRLAE